MHLRLSDVSPVSVDRARATAVPPDGPRSLVLARIKENIRRTKQDHRILNLETVTECGGSQPE
jgi:hypothetical protein